ncbi:MAG: TolC family protein [Deltaproteobacteria bacterium]|nr:TolC family protein [Deltaproteobacteria bacterium]
MDTHALVRVAPWLVLVLTPLVAGGSARAEPLDAFVRAALVHAEPGRASRARVEAADADVTRARASLLPSVVASAGYTRHGEASEATLPSADGRARQVTLRPEDQLDGAVTVHVPVLDGRSWARLSAARADARASRAQRVATDESITIAVVRAYHEAVAATRVEEAARVSLTASRAHESVMRARRDAGEVTALALARAEVETARAAESLVVARAERRRARRLLRSLTGSSAAPDAAVSTAAPPSGSVRALVDRALRTRGLVAASRAALDRSEAEARAAGFAQVPVVAAYLTGHAGNATGFTDEQVTWEGGATVTWLVFDSFGSDAGRTAARARVEATRADLAEAVRVVRLEVADAYDRVAIARERVQAASRERAVAVEAERLARVELDAGTATSADVLLARRDAFDARVREVRADAELAVAVETLRVAVGDGPRR